MGYRIDFAVREDMMRAIVFGKSSNSHARWIARDIAGQADREAVRRLLIDVRRLADRVGRLGTLLMAKGGPRDMKDCRVAVVDVKENDPYYVFAETAARGRGYALRYFYDPAAAESWLRDSGDRATG